MGVFRKTLIHLFSYFSSSIPLLNLKSLGDLVVELYCFRHQCYFLHFLPLGGYLEIFWKTLKHGSIHFRSSTPLSNFKSLGDLVAEVQCFIFSFLLWPIMFVRVVLILGHFGKC